MAKYCMPTLTSRSLMTNETAVLSFHDKILAKIFLPIIPNWIKPNHLTVLRFLMIPPVAYLTWTENWVYMIPTFLIAGFTDVLDGSLARVRKQITLWGTIADPAADKLLIGSVAVLFLSKEVSFLLAFLLVFMEVLIVLGAYSRRKRGEYLSANWSGKIKMFLQVSGLSCLLLAQFGLADILNPLGVFLIILSLGFAVTSLITYGL